MKLQDVILKAMAKKITWLEAAEIAGVTDRTIRRMRDRYQEFGYNGLFDQRRGKRSIHRVPMEKAEEVLRLYRELYFDLNMRHFHEKLSQEHEIHLSYSWVQQALQGAGLVAKKRKRGTHRRRRPRRPLVGMMLHIDGSKHQWFQDDQWHDLIVILDDANTEIYYAQLVLEESTRTVMAGLWEVIARQGRFCSLYSDRASHFFVTPKAGEKVDKTRFTQVGRALKELGVQMIPAYSPQARGRSERSFGTWQGRLPQELRLAQITTIEAANEFLQSTYIAQFNANFKVQAEEKGTAFRRCSRKDLEWVFTIQTERVVDKDNTVAIAARSWQLDQTKFKSTLAGSTVTIHEHLDTTVSIRFGPHIVGRFDAHGTSLQKRSERRGKAGSMEAGETKKRFPPPPTPPWESRQRREIPPFPPRRRRLAWGNPKPRRLPPPSNPNRTDHVLIKPDILTC